MSRIVKRAADWLRGKMPTREGMAAHPWMARFAHRFLTPELWRFTRRSVPRGVAVGLLVGIFALIPGVQIVGAALMCVPCRANIPLAAALTFLSNPATTPFILAASIYVGNLIGYHADLATLNALYSRGASLSDWGYWLISDAAPALLVGLFIISTIAASVGYLVASWVWRAWVGRKLRLKRERLAQQPGPAE